MKLAHRKGVFVTSTQEMLKFLVENQDIEINELVKMVKSKFDYSERTSTSPIKQRIQNLKKKHKELFHSKQIPSSNNSGHLRKPLTSEAIQARSYFLFNARIVKQMMTEKEYTNFVDKYVEIRQKYKINYRTYIPSMEHLQIFEKFSQGKMTIEDLEKSFGFLVGTKSVKKQRTLNRIGAIYAYIAKNKHQQNKSVS